MDNIEILTMALLTVCCTVEALYIKVLWNRVEALLMVGRMNDEQ